MRVCNLQTKQTSTMKSLLFISTLCCSLIHLNSRAQTDEAAKPPPDAAGKLATVEVSGIRDPEWRPYRTMLKGLNAFDAKHQLAPSAELRFVLRPQGAKDSIKGIEMRLTGHETSIAVPVAEDGTFVLPRSQAAADENAEIVLNRRKDAMRWRPHIRSPNLKPDQPRLGDLRLECEILWAIEYDEMPFIVRNSFRLLGGPCKSSNVAIFFGAPAHVASATIFAGAKHETLAVGQNKRSFRPPLHDTSWGDDALIEFQFTEANTILHQPD